MTDRVIRVIMDTSGVERGSRRASRSLSQVERRTGTLARGFRGLARAATGLVAALGARELLRTADTFNRIENQLRIVTDSTDQLVRSQQELFDIAQDTRQPLESTVELFTRASIAADELGASEQELFSLVEITNQALAVQGSTSAEASGALRQLSQSFASGIVRAEEFNSILEGAFPLAQAAARGLDETAGSVGRLRNLVVEGQLKSEDFFRAILEGGDELSKQFEQTVPTVSQALTVLNNSFITFVGQLDEATGVTDSLAEAIIDLAGDLTLLGGALTGNLTASDELSDNLQKVAIAGIVAGEALSQLFNLVDVGISFFQDLGEIIGGTAAAIVAAFRGEFAGALGALQDLDFSRTEDSFGRFFDSLDAGSQAVSEKISQVLLPAFRDLEAASDALSDRERVLPILNSNTQKDIDGATDAINDFQNALIQQEQILRITAQGGDDVAESIARYREELELAGAEAEIFGELQPTEEVNALREAFRSFAAESIESQRALRSEIEAADLAATFNEQIDALEQEIFLLNADTEALSANAEARALAAGATVDQAAKIGELTQVLEEEREALRQETQTLEGFFEEVRDSAQSTLSGFLADPLSEGLDELPFKFAQILQQLAADALASELFSILGNLGGGGAGGGGGALGFLGGLFGGGFQAGGQVMGGRPVMVGERGPEIFTPPGSGTITPNVSINQAAQAAPTVVVNNITDPADIPAGLRTAEGEEEVINIIQRNPGAVKQILG